MIPQELFNHVLNLEDKLVILLKPDVLEGYSNRHQDYLLEKLVVLGGIVLSQFKLLNVCKKEEDV